MSADACSPRMLATRRSLSVAERTSYLKAVKCMLRKPALTSKVDLPGVQNRFEDFMGDHIRQTNDTHFVGLFYPRHRLLVWAYEQEIRACGFRGAQPYWDWSLDSGSAEDFFNSPVFDTKTGFGGNGEFLPFNTSGLSPLLPITDGKVPSAIADRSGGGCVHDGPFANMTIHMGPGPSTAYKAQCVRRDFVPSNFMASASVEAVSTGMDYADFGSFTRQTELTVHGAGHVGVGGLYGVLTDAWASPGDPLFYLHHANMDRLWWSWQSKNLSTRLREISGPIVANDWLNEKGRNVTLDDIVFVGTTVNVTMPIRDVMDIRKSLGYVYDKLY
ncbi:Tyrosinase-like protein orsC [Colletotrichum siamense]|uniref:Tyrosinase-like protein orsC n=1 Tax=Colletotrichum siamense TaxID=690259 RepID=A0A9P5EQ32_COLSI|nr:Tyrosinase-like protein orsC [Colletotrichum siamense]KAF4857422.1 Tyrosinase-like protein orsC [Colletotrichum siamense]